jgi:hypothetical protein
MKKTKYQAILLIVGAVIGAVVFGGNPQRVDASTMYYVSTCGVYTSGDTSNIYYIEADILQGTPGSDCLVFDVDGSTTIDGQGYLMEGDIRLVTTSSNERSLVISNAVIDGNVSVSGASGYPSRSLTVNLGSVITGNIYGDGGGDGSSIIIENSTINGDILVSGQDGVGANEGESGTTGSAGGSVSIQSSQLNGNIYANGGTGGLPGDTEGTTYTAGVGGVGGSVSLGGGATINGNIAARGGNGHAASAFNNSNAGNAGAGGTVTISSGSTVVATVDIRGGDGGAGRTGADGGHFTGDCLDGADGLEGGDGGAGGQGGSLTSSGRFDIALVGGGNGGAGGDGGNGANGGYCPSGLGNGGAGGDGGVGGDGGTAGSGGTASVREVDSSNTSVSAGSVGTAGNGGPLGGTGGGSEENETGADGVSGLAGFSGGSGSAGTLSILRPTVSYVTSSTSNGTYGVGQSISIQVVFSESVTVTGGTPTLTLETGETDRLATYTGGGSTDTLTFAYTVSAGDTSADLNYTSTSALAANGATIAGADGSVAGLALASPGAINSLGSNKAIVISSTDTTAPSVSLTSPSNGALASSTIALAASASDNVAVSGVTFKRNTNTVIGSEDTTSTYGISWDTTAVSDGQHTLIAVARDAAGNYATSSSSTITVDNTAPTVLSASSTKAAGPYTVGESIDIDIEFSEAVTSTGSVTITLETGATDRTCTFTLSSTTYGTCSYTVQAGDTSADLTVSSITGTVRDIAGNVYAGGLPSTNLAANEAIVIDTTTPTVSVTDPSEGESHENSVSMAASADDALAGVAGVRFWFADASEPFGDEDTSSPYTFTWDATLEARGEYGVIAVARDAAGNYATSSEVTFIVADPIEEEVDEEGGDESTTSRRPASRRRSTSTSNAASAATAGGISGSTANTTSTGTSAFTRDTQLGDVNEEVRMLQKFLNTQGFVVAQTGAGSRGNETTVFGPATRAALIAFQQANSIVPASGYFGPTTRARVETLMGGVQQTPQAQEQVSVPQQAVGAFARDLQINDVGDDVRALQMLLAERATGPAAIALKKNGVTGYFGALTQAALIELQKDRGITPAAGYFGKKTREALGL